MSQRSAFLIKALLSGAILTLIVSRANLREVVGALTTAHLGWLALAAVMPTIGTAISAIRWNGLLDALGFHAKVRTLFASCMVAKFVGQFLPSMVAGDVVRAYDTWRAGASKSVAITAIVADRFFGVLVLVLFAGVAVCFPQELTRRFPIFYYWIGVGAGSLLVCFWIVLAPSGWLINALRKFAQQLPRRSHSFIARVAMPLKAYHGQAGAVCKALSLSILLQVNVVTFYYFIGRSMGLEISYGLFYLIVPIAVVVMMVPVSLNSIGVRESIFVFLLGLYAIDDAHAVAFAWLEYGIVVAYGLVGGIVYALRKSRSGNYDAQAAKALTKTDCDVNHGNKSSPAKLTQLVR